MEKRIIFASILLFILAAFCCKNNRGVSTNSNKPIIAVVQPATIDAFEKLKAGLQEQCGGKFELKYYSAEGDASKFGTVLESSLLNHPAYLVTVGSQLTDNAFGPEFVSRLPIVIASAISAPDKVPSLAKVGINPPRAKPVIIISDNPKKDIYTQFASTVKILLPRARKVGILYNPSELNSAETRDNLKKSLLDSGLNVSDGAINNIEDVEKITNVLCLAKVDLVIIPHDKNAVTKAPSIVKICNQYQIPVFSLDDGTVEKSGVAIGISVDYNLIGKLIGETINRLDSSKVQASSIPVLSLPSAAVYTNSTQIQRFKISIPKDLTVIKFN